MYGREDFQILFVKARIDNSAIYPLFSLTCIFGFHNGVFILIWINTGFYFNEEKIYNTFEMEAYMKKFLTFLFIAALLTACSRGIATEKPVAPQLNISDPAKNLEAAVGNEFKIIIDSNPSTGYHWEILGDVDKSGGIEAV